MGAILDFLKPAAKGVRKWAAPRRNAILGLAAGMDPYAPTLSQGFAAGLPGLMAGRQADSEAELLQMEKDARHQEIADISRARSGTAAYLASQAKTNPAAKQYLDLLEAGGLQPNEAAKGYLSATAGPEPTDDIREYQFYAQQERTAGREPAGFSEWLQQIKSSGASRTNVNLPGTDKFAEGLGKGLADTAQGTLEAGSKAAQTVSRLGVLSNLADRIETGPLTGALATMGGIAQQLGVDIGVFGIDPNMPANAQALNGLSNMLIGGLIGTGPEALLPANMFTEKDRELILSTVPQLSDTPGAFQIKLKWAQAMAQYSVEKSTALQQALTNARRDPDVSEYEAYLQFLAEWEDPAAAEERAQRYFGGLVAESQPFATGTPDASGGVVPYSEYFR